MSEQYREGKKRRKYKFLFFKGHFYCHYYKPEEMETERRSVRYASSLRNIALLLVQNKFGNEKFSAIHVRLGDYEVNNPIENRLFRSLCLIFFRSQS